MPTYLYCLLRAGSDAPPPGLVGHGGAEVRSLEAGALQAWVSDLPAEARIERSPDAARIHDAVCAAVLARGETPVPARFGQTFESDADCVAEIRDKERELQAALNLVRGCVEMTVHLAIPVAGETSGSHGDTPDEIGDAGPGLKHLQRIRRDLHAEHNLQRRALAAAERLRREAGEVVRAEKIGAGAGEGVVVAHLVTTTGLGTYRSALTKVRNEDGTPVRWSGPWVPYSFT